MRQRLISAAVLVPVVVILFVLGPPWLTLGVVLLTVLASAETAALATRAGFPTTGWLSAPFAALYVIGLGAAFGPNGIPDAWALVPPGLAVFGMIAAVAALWFAEPTKGLRAWLGTMLAMFYPGLLAYLAAFVGFNPAPQTGSIFGFHLDDGRILLLILVATVWTLDSAAYLAGRYHGRGRFMNHISPNKTWSGAIGGTIAAIVICALLFAGSGQSLIGGAALGLVIAVAAQAGDLAESMLKRAAGVKDSGTLIPGHGGILDRLDSFLFAAPAMYAALVVIGFLHARGVL
jgi:CDP-diglyceride synthetase